jgi:hypothetical protein
VEGDDSTFNGLAFVKDFALNGLEAAVAGAGGAAEGRQQGQPPPQRRREERSVHESGLPFRACDTRSQDSQSALDLEEL